MNKLLARPLLEESGEKQLLCKSIAILLKYARQDFTNL